MKSFSMTWLYALFIVQFKSQAVTATICTCMNENYYTMLLIIVIHIDVCRIQICGNNTFTISSIIKETL